MNGLRLGLSVRARAVRAEQFLEHADRATDTQQGLPQRGRLPLQLRQPALPKLEVTVQLREPGLHLFSHLVVSLQIAVTRFHRLCAGFCRSTIARMLPTTCRCTVDRWSGSLGSRESTKWITTSNRHGSRRDHTGISPATSG